MAQRISGHHLLLTRKVISEITPSYHRGGKVLYASEAMIKRARQIIIVVPAYYSIALSNNGSVTAAG